MKLSKVQEQIVLTSGNMIVKASAGTGKTYTMVNKIVKEINANRTHKVVAAITFTIKAAKEIKDRIAIDVSRHFVGTNNSFAIEEVIKPFFKDVYGEAYYNVDLSTDYSIKIDSFDAGIQKIAEDLTLCSYRDNTKNFIFELAKHIVEKSEACKRYLRAKYFKIYIDEYQDCDRDMHDFFMYLCDELNIETFIVGDEKQSIYMWRGAYPEAFRSIWGKPGFEKIFMGNNYRSCQQIQNYSNLLYSETRHLYKPIPKRDNIYCLLAPDQTWITRVMEYVDSSQTSALLRFSNDNAKNGALLLSEQGLECVYIPQIPIASITTDAAWLYSTLSKYMIIKKYSVYDFISEIPVEGDASKKNISVIGNYLNKIENSFNVRDVKIFESEVERLANYIGYSTNTKHVKMLYDTIVDSSYHVAFEPEKYKHVAITFHSSKGLEFDQVIVFAEDYRLSDASSICNHYVAVTRAKYKLIIVCTNSFSSNTYINNINRIFSEKKLRLKDVVFVDD